MALVSVIELPAFSVEADLLFTEDEHAQLIAYLAASPRAGDLIQGTGGMRKLRWGMTGRGKRGGARVIYYFHDERMPLYLLTAFAKNERSDLSAKDRRALADVVAILKKRGG